MLNEVGQIYSGALRDKVRSMTEGPINDGQGSFRSGRRCVDLIFTLKHLGEKTRRRNRGFI